jgi:hypothetical protein
MTPKVGQYLYSSCRASDVGKILRVGEDANKCPVVDIELFEWDILTHAGEDRVNEPDAKSDPPFGIASLLGIEVRYPSNALNPDAAQVIENERTPVRQAHIVLTEVQYEPGSILRENGGDCDIIRLNTPGDGCFRCDKSFELRDCAEADHEMRGLPLAEQLRASSEADAFQKHVTDLVLGLKGSPKPKLLSTMTIKLPEDPDAPPPTYGVELFAMGMAVGGRARPEPVGAWEMWLSLGSNQRNELRRAAWRMMRQCGLTQPAMVGGTIPMSYEARAAEAKESSS